MLNDLGHAFGQAWEGVQVHVKAIQSKGPFAKGTSSVKASPSAQARLQDDRKALTGRWRRVPELCDQKGLKQALDLMNVNFLVRRGAGILKHMEIEDSPDSFTMVMKAGGILDVREKYAWTGEPATYSRRDKRRGRAVGCVARDPQRGPCISVDFGEPQPGKAIDYYTVQEDGKLVVSSQIIVHGKGEQSYTCATLPTPLAT